MPDERNAYDVGFVHTHAMEDRRRWVIYGANGYTGELIARETVRRGHHPILAGRSATRIEPLARELGCEWRAFTLDRIGDALDDAALVLHCAGPFLETSAAMVAACLRAGAHYLDITGEIAVFEAIMKRHSDAVAHGVTLLPGVGFDVVPTDCLAAMLAARMPDATGLVLAFQMRGSTVSRGTSKTMLESIGAGGAIRRDGRIVKVPVAFDAREIPFPSGRRVAMTIPWGDVSTAFHTTHIPNIRVYAAASPRTIRGVRMAGPFLPLLAWTPVKRGLQKIAGRRNGPDERQRAAGRAEVWGEVTNARAESVSMSITTPEAYAFTAMSAVSAVERVLDRALAGAFTPARLLGPEFVKTIPGVMNAP
ncbi:MAG: saccharopine dehydrogenase family protein [Thermoanaerobaculia bacterium]